MEKVASPVDKTSIVIESADDGEMQRAVTATLDAAGVSVEELRGQAAASRFVSERARRAWFVVSPFLASR
ncbi:MAG: hypothetical protein M1522_09555 [Actinobacteria bacterium]|nr:hypothetical protein [Actinomycetota bacterium]MDA8183346.1 hypothetical protein [Actinomycetota bacterium]